ncbi:MAG: FMN-binding negative transcriptional regulator [Rhodospirillaceae bacterium]
MYMPSHFEQTRAEALHALIREYPLGALVTLRAGALNADHVPFDFDPTPAPHGTLRGHVGRGNPIWRDAGSDREVLVIFQGPSGYITPSWYPSKKEHGKVVPTYNYAVVHAYGKLRAVDDRTWLRALVTRLTDRHEAHHSDPWHVTDAPGDYIDKMLAAIVGVEITVTRLLGKWKVSQNRTPVDQTGVVDGLKASGNAHDLVMAQLVEQYGKPQRDR